jgi:hypothetical protein
LPQLSLRPKIGLFPFFIPEFWHKIQVIIKKL